MTDNMGCHQIHTSSDWFDSDRAPYTHWMDRTWCYCLEIDPHLKVVEPVRDNKRGELGRGCLIANSCEGRHPLG